MEGSYRSDVIIEVWLVFYFSDTVPRLKKYIALHEISHIWYTYLWYCQNFENATGTIKNNNQLIFNGKIAY